MDNNYSFLTAISRKSYSVPVRWLKANGLLKGRILDYGCGRGFDFYQLSEEGYNCDAYDPHFQPIMPKGKFDTIYCVYVLDHLLEEERTQVIVDIRARLKLGGNAFIAVHRDFTTEGFIHYDAHRNIYQANVQLDLPIIYQTHKFTIYQLSA